MSYPVFAFKNAIVDSREARVVWAAPSEHRADHAWILAARTGSAGPYFYVYICCSQFFISVNFRFSFVLNSLAYNTIPKDNGRIN